MDHLSTIQEKVLLLSPTLSYWRGTYQIKAPNMKVEIGSDEISGENLTTPAVKCLSTQWPIRASTGKPWLKEFQQLASDHKAVCERFSLPFPIRGVRIVPKAVGVDFMEALDGGSHLSIRGRLKVLEDEFVGDFERILTSIHSNIGDAAWIAIRNKIPRTERRLRRCFGVSVTPVELAGSSATRVDRSDLERHAEAMRAACLQKAEEAMQIMFAAPRQQLADALTSLKELIDREGRVTSRSFAPVREAIDKIRMFDFAGSELVERVHEIEQRLAATDPAEVRENQQIAASLSEVAGAWAAEIREVVQEAGGEAEMDAVLNRAGSFRALILN